MRITNKIMQNNSLSNINLAKVAEDVKSSQVTSGKKIVRPSDDPIVAIRSLRLRSNVVEITQYYSRNAKDADAWIKTTEDAMQQVSDVLTDMMTQYNKGANEYLTSGNRNIILEQLKSLQKEVYATGDADYAGRYIFTGYRTESSLMFAEDTTKPYQITEQLTASDLKTNTFVNTSYEVLDAAGSGTGTYRDLTNIQEGTQADYGTLEEKFVEKSDYHRIRLSYKDCDEVVMPAIEYLKKEEVEEEVTVRDENGNIVKNADGTDKKETVKVLKKTVIKIDETGETTTTVKSHKYGVEPPVSSVRSNVMRQEKSTDTPSPYQNVDADEVVYLSDTGELLLGENIYKALSDLKDDPLTGAVNEGEIRVTYQKSKFKDGDLRPEHYFYCIAAGKDGVLGKKADGTTTTPGADGTDDIVYNPKYLDYGKERQVIEYDIGFNQRLQVNTIAEECFNPAVVREVDDMVQALEKIQKIEDVIGTLKKMLDKETVPTKQKVLQDQIDAANKAFTYEKEVVQKKFSAGISVIQGFQDEVNVAVTGCGARGSRLELVTSRLSSQKVIFDTLKSENEDVDLSEAVVELTSAEMTYEAALKATGKIMQVNLMDFI